MIPFPVIESRLATQAAAMGESAICSPVSTTWDLVGFALLYRWRHELYARIVGFDYERLPPDSRVYFTIMFYEPIRYAITNGIKVIDYGLETGDAKVGRGCVLAPRWSVTYNAADPNAQNKANIQILATPRVIMVGRVRPILWSTTARPLGITRLATASTASKRTASKTDCSCRIMYSTILTADSRS